MAGAIGVPPEPFRWGELMEMVEGLSRHAWDQTSFLSAAVLAPWSRRALTPADLNPFGPAGARTGDGRGGTRSRKPGAIPVRLRDLAPTLKRQFVELPRQPAM